MCMFVAVSASAPEGALGSLVGIAILAGLFFLAFHGARRNEKHRRHEWSAVRKVVDTEQVVSEQQEVIENLTEQTMGTLAPLEISQRHSADSASGCDGQSNKRPCAEMDICFCIMTSNAKAIQHSSPSRSRAGSGKPFDHQFCQLPCRSEM